MARSLISRNWRVEDVAALERLACASNCGFPPPDLLPADCCVVEDGETVLGFGALYRVPGVSIATTDWIMLEPHLSREDRAAVLGRLLDFFREVRQREGLAAVMVYSPFEEIREHLVARDLQEGEREMSRLSVRFRAA
ncbi:hypothetical protein LAZ40_03335 [Cereibacter sphaeroides]|uniref:hypothetical protein n=1 Tax=Cereibacter sphaeroides TaxID=1063 RepID=UPI001F383B2A|nr:hypothetical protein [Cereibacter sphaeroides]MCE6958089.1 hypothetical protein [Cereibacter sphaeroides]MCE6971424.1 hypothetical protein [Cereibacter sphaeroides]